MRPRIMMRLLSALGLVVAWAGVCPASAQQSTSSTAVFDDWSLRCQTSNASGAVSKVCEVRSTLAAKATDGRQVVVLVIAVGKTSPDKPNQVVVNAPTSVWLPVGVKLQDNGGKTLLELPYTSCKASMCAAAAAPTDAQWGAVVGAGEEIFALYRTDAAQDVKVRISLKGLVAAYKAMLKETAAK